MKKIFLLIVFGGLIFPLLSSAAGLVPCGEPGNPCQFCHLFVLLDNIIDFVFKFIILPVATLLLVIGGGMFFFYVENPQKVERAKSLLTATIIGLVVIFSSWLVVGLFLTAIGLSDFTVNSIWPNDWFTIDCPT